MHGLTLLAAALCASTAAAAFGKSTNRPAPLARGSGLETRQACESGYVECGGGCISTDDTCCPDGSYCLIDEHCFLGDNAIYGCCDDGAECSGNAAQTTVDGGGFASPTLSAANESPTFSEINFPTSAIGFTSVGGGSGFTATAGGFTMTVPNVATTVGGFTPGATAPHNGAGMQLVGGAMQTAAAVAAAAMAFL